MDSLFAFKGKDFVIICADTTINHNIIKFKNHQDKIKHIDQYKLLAMGGQMSDILQFGDYIHRNIQYYYYKYRIHLNTQQTANFIRSELAQAIRQGPYFVNCILAGYDQNGPSLYMIDYLGTLIKTDKAIQGYSQYFLYSLLDSFQKKELAKQQGLDIARYCIRQLNTRFSINQDKFVIKIITKVF